MPSSMPGIITRGKVFENIDKHFNQAVKNGDVGVLTETRDALLNILDSKDVDKALARYYLNEHVANREEGKHILDHFLGDGSESYFPSSDGYPDNKAEILTVARIRALDQMIAAAKQGKQLFMHTVWTCPPLLNDSDEFISKFNVSLIKGEGQITLLIFAPSTNNVPRYSGGFHAEEIWFVTDTNSADALMTHALKRLEEAGQQKGLPEEDIEKLKNGLDEMMRLPESFPKKDVTVLQSVF